MRLSEAQQKFLKAVRDRTDGVAVMEGEEGAVVTNFFHYGPPVRLDPASLLLLKERGLYGNYDITEAGRTALSEAEDG